MNFIKRGWQGQFKPLDIMLGTACLAALIVILVFLIIGYVHPKSLANAMLNSIYMLMQPVNIWLTVALWRSVRNSQWFWKYAIRSLCIYGWASTLWNWLNLGLAK